MAGCADGTPTPAPGPSLSAVAVPNGGVSLAQLGFRHGPAAAVTLPAGVRPGLRVDQPNLLTLTIEEPPGAMVEVWLRSHLPAAGFTIRAEGGGGLLFDGHGWQGAFTATEADSALTLRRAS